MFEWHTYFHLPDFVRITFRNIGFSESKEIDEYMIQF